MKDSSRINGGKKCRLSHETGYPRRVAENIQSLEIIPCPNGYFTRLQQHIKKNDLAERYIKELVLVKGTSWKMISNYLKKHATLQDKGNFVFALDDLVRSKSISDSFLKDNKVMDSGPEVIASMIARLKEPPCPEIYLSKFPFSNDPEHIVNKYFNMIHSHRKYFWLLIADDACTGDIKKSSAFAALIRELVLSDELDSRFLPEPITWVKC